MYAAGRLHQETGRTEYVSEAELSSYMSTNRTEPPDNLEFEHSVQLRY